MGGYFWKNKPIYSPKKLLEIEFDKVIVMSEIHFTVIKEDLIYWYGINAKKIKDHGYLLKLLLIDKYKNTEDLEIKSILEYWKNNKISIYSHYIKERMEMHTVFMDSIENLPYILYEDKKMYFPYNYRFEEYDGKKVVWDITSDQQLYSPHLYIKDNIKVDKGDIIVDAGVQEGNFSLKYIEKVSKAYLFECDKYWIKPLQKTFEKFKDKVILSNTFLGRFNGGMYSNLDAIVKGKLDFLKMDIEGAEVEALLGGRNVLLNNKVKCAICSYHKSGDEAAIKDVLKSYGYKTDTSQGYMVFYYDKNIYSTLDLRKGIVYGKK